MASVRPTERSARLRSQASVAVDTSSRVWARLQFALTGAVDRLRSHQPEPAEPDAVVLAACDPANPYGAALPWPDREGHRPGRKAGALVVLVGGALIFYVERGGRTLLSFTEDPTRLAPAAAALARSVQQGLLGKLTVERADGAHVFGSIPVSEALQAAVDSG